MRQASLKPSCSCSRGGGAGSEDRLRNRPVLLSALSCGPSAPDHGPFLGAATLHSRQRVHLHNPSMCLCRHAVCGTQQHMQSVAMH